MGPLASVPAFFALRVGSALLLLKLSTSFLPVSGFAIFSQFMLLAALLNLVAVGGVQNGLIRQIAAANNPEALARTQRAAFTIWAIGIPVLALPIALASREISVVLVGEPTQARAVIIVTLLALIAGPGQIWCSILSGRKHVVGSLAAQAIGLLAGVALGAIFLVRGDEIAAVIGFACGPLLTMAVAFLLAARLRIPARPLPAIAEMRALLRYSAAFAATTGFTSIVLFGLRYAYRETFDPTALGYWIAANRISDISTQLLGLFMIQFFVPHLTTIDDEARRRVFTIRCWAAGAIVLAGVVTVFSIAARPLVHLFLSDAYLPAIPAIRTYMLGDFLRVWASLAMFTAFARGRPGRYAAIEIGTLTIMAAITVALIAAGEPRAPQIGYLGAYAITAIAVTLMFFRRRLAARTTA